MCLCRHFPFQSRLLPGAKSSSFGWNRFSKRKEEYMQTASIVFASSVCQQVGQPTSLCRVREPQSTCTTPLSWGGCSMWNKKASLCSKLLGRRGKLVGRGTKGPFERGQLSWDQEEGGFPELCSKQAQTKLPAALKMHFVKL